MKIPFLDLNAQYANIQDEIHIAIKQVLESKKFVQNQFCNQLARDFLNVHGGNFGVGCSNGTSAITLVLKALGVGYGDEVITVNNTFFATIEAICEVGAKPVLVDCLPDSYGIDCELVEKAISKKTKAVIPVHLYGNPCDMEKLCDLAKEHRIHLIEDCAQAHLATYKKKPVGTFGSAGTFSFFPGKNLGAYGDAGFVITDNEDLHKMVSMHINHGRTKKYEHEFMAGNYRMDDIQAAILSVKCRYISDWTERRISIAKKYDEILKKRGFKVIEIMPGSRCVYHLYVIEVKDRSEIMQKLHQNGVGTGIHYPIPINLQPACVELGYKRGSFPISEEMADKILSLPIYPEMTDESILYVTDLLD
ncbi:MAG: DegT/DnrJ/EryC1/StrS family aminotransferase [Halobacteriovoraceae bacterium]|nr:DegT/DnrJ/EryC1/StrS family aminotransferase [Halobacteriovoraceae bacterium]